MPRLPLNAKHFSVATIVREVGRWSTDIALGWEAGLLGQARRRGKLYERQAPDHFYERHNLSRLRSWQLGQEKAKNYRALNLRLTVHFAGTADAGPVTGVYKGWSVQRGRVVSRLAAKHGCFGDVSFYYFEGTDLIRTVHCGV